MCCRPAFSGLSATALLLGLALLLAAACQPVPQPFAPAHKAGPGGPNLVLSPRVGLVVRPPDGLADAAAAARVAEHLAEALRRHDFTASTRPGHRGSAVLSGRLVDGKTLEWRMVDASGVLHAESRQPLDAALGPPEGYDDALWRSLADATAMALDRAERDLEQGSDRRVELAAVEVGPIDGAPGNGRQALAAELRRALRDAGVPSPDGEAEDFLLLLGSIHLGPAQGARQEVEILWQLIRADGLELGRIAQRNQVPVGQLDGAWGGLARNIAEAATDGIVDLLRNIGPGAAS